MARMLMRSEKITSPAKQTRATMWVIIWYSMIGEEDFSSL